MTINYFNNSESEQYLLGGILNHNDILDRYSIDRSLFYEQSHREIFDTIQRIRATGSLADMPSVALASPLNSVQIASLSSYQLSDIAGTVKRLQDCATARELAKVLQEISEAQGDGEDPKEVLEKATSHIMAITQHGGTSYRTLVQVAADAIHEIEERRKCKTEYSGVQSGIEPLDRMTDGFQAGDYILLGARPSVGKTALALSLATKASQAGARVGFVSLEMKDTALMKRMLSAASSVGMNALRTGLFGLRGLSDLVNGAAAIANLPIYFADVPNMSIIDLVSEARILRHREKINFLVIDYIGLIQASQGETPRWEVFSAVSQKLKSLARELNIPVLALSQLGRQADGKRPGLSDLRESGSLEQDADVILFIHREVENSNAEKQPVKLIVAKQRNGETGDIDLMFDRARMKFHVAQKESV